MTTSEFTWPTSNDYDFSMMNLQKMAIDEDIRTGQVEMNEGGFGIRSYGGGKLYTTTYRIISTHFSPKYAMGFSGDWMVRCFCTTPNGDPPSDIAKRYKKISEFSLAHTNSKLPNVFVDALLPIFYVDKAIKVPYIDEDRNIATRTETLPIVKMPFIQAPSLGSFVAKYHKQQEKMKQLCKAWLYMIRQLEHVHMAHGDLDLTNVLVIQVGEKLTLKLIDYDNVWIQSLDGLKQTERGHEAFQHPSYKRPYNAEMDRFSALTIYISIRALYFHSHLHHDYGADDTHRLLFSKEDYQKETQASVNSHSVNRIAELRAVGIPELAPYLDQLSLSLQKNCMPCSLDSVPLPEVEILRWDVPADSMLPVVRVQKGPPTPQPVLPVTPQPVPVPVGPSKTPSTDTQRHISLEPKKSYAWVWWLVIAILMGVGIIVVVAITHHPGATTPFMHPWSALAHMPLFSLHNIVHSVDGTIRMRTVQGRIL